MTTASRVLGVYRTTGAREAATIYETPEGYATIVKSVLVFNESAAALAVQVFLVSSTHAGSPRLVYADLEPFTVLNWEGWVMLDVGDQLLVYAPGPDVSFWASGAALRITG